MSDANPLLSIPFAIPFDQIRAEHVEPAMAQLIAEARARIEALRHSFSVPLTMPSTSLEPGAWTGA